MKKILFFIVLGISLELSITTAYSMFSSTIQMKKRKPQPQKERQSKLPYFRKIMEKWAHFNEFTKKHAYRLSRDGMETSSTWRRAAVRAAQKDNNDIQAIALHIASFIQEAAKPLFYHQNRFIYNEPVIEAMKNASIDTADLAKHEELTIRILYDDEFVYSEPL
ncbi:MAG TPA: hypothetical protein VJJ26_01005 [Candidatus Babeliales bacterium]|nr:hypothetical protein [Candidatus Babeliales bacterium]